MTDERLRANLRRLPDGRATDGFTAAVLARVDELERRRQRRPAGLAARLTSPRLLTAAAALTAAVLAAAVLLPRLPAAGPPSGSDAPAVASTPDADAGSATDPSSTRTDASTTPVPSPAPARVPSTGTPPAATPNLRTAEQPSGHEPGTTFGPAAAPATGAPSSAATPSDEASGNRLAAASTTGSDDGLSDADRRALARRLAELRRERERLAQQLAAFDAAVPDRRPALVLAGDESVELVLDVGAARARQGGGGGSGIRPAGYRPDDRPRLY